MNDLAILTEQSTFGSLRKGRGRVFRLTSAWHLDGEVHEAVAIFHDMESIVDWWPAAFMRVEVVDPGGAESLGKVVRLHTKGLLPHTFEFLARMGVADSPDAVTIEVLGDFRGFATVAARRVADHLVLSFDWWIEVHHQWIGVIAPLARPILAWNHRWVMRHGRAGLQREIHRLRGVPIDQLGPIRMNPTFPHNVSFVRNLYGWRRCPAVWTK